MSTPDPLDSADKWARIGLYVGIGGGFSLLVAVAVHWANAGEALLPGPIYFTLVAGMIVLVMGSWNGMRERRIARALMAHETRLMAQLHIVRLQVLSLEQGLQRRPPVVAHHVYAGRSSVRDAITDQTPVVLAETIEAKVEKAESADETPGLTPEMVEIARRTTKRLRGSS